MRFAIILPAIRDNVSHVVQALYASLTQPTDVFILKDTWAHRTGHLQTLNYAVGNLLETSRHNIAVKMDDDILLAHGWQDAIAAAFDEIETLGVCGLDVSHTDIGNEYMLGGMPERQMLPVQNIGGVKFREFTGAGNVGGMCMATPAVLMKSIGDIPIVQGNHYPFYADGYYNNECRKRGYRIGYVLCNPAPTPIMPDDPAEYGEAKEEETARIHNDAMDLFK